MAVTHMLRNQRGTSTLEFVAVLPTLLLIFLGGIELSRAWLVAQIAADAVREGARFAAVTPVASNPSGAGVTKINDVLASAGITAQSGPTVTCSPAPCAANSQVLASVTVRFETLVPLFLPMIGTIDISQSARMRYE